MHLSKESIKQANMVKELVFSIDGKCIATQICNIEKCHFGGCEHNSQKGGVAVNMMKTKEKDMQLEQVVPGCLKIRDIETAAAIKVIQANDGDISDNVIPNVSVERNNEKLFIDWTTIGKNKSRTYNALEDVIRANVKK